MPKNKQRMLYYPSLLITIMFHIKWLQNYELLLNATIKTRKKKKCNCVQQIKRENIVGLIFFGEKKGVMIKKFIIIYIIIK